MNDDPYLSVEEAKDQRHEDSLTIHNVVKN